MDNYWNDFRIAVYERIADNEKILKPEKLVKKGNASTGLTKTEIAAAFKESQKAFINVRSYFEAISESPLIDSSVKALLYNLDMELFTLERALKLQRQGVVGQGRVTLDFYELMHSDKKAFRFKLFEKMRKELKDTGISIQMLAKKYYKQLDPFYSMNPGNKQWESSESLYSDFERWNREKNLK